MIKLTNRFTGSDMWVADSRLEEYLAAGHVPADKADAPQDTEKAERPKRKSRK